MHANVLLIDSLSLISILQALQVCRLLQPSTVARSHSHRLNGDAQIMPNVGVVAKFNCQIWKVIPKHAKLQSQNIRCSPQAAQPAQRLSKMPK